MILHIIPDDHKDWKNFCGTFHPATYYSLLKSGGNKSRKICKNCLKIMRHRNKKETK